MYTEFSFDHTQSLTDTGRLKPFRTAFRATLSLSSSNAATLIELRRHAHRAVDDVVDVDVVVDVEM